MLPQRKTFTQSTKLSIGLEVHVQLLTKTKIFCGCPNVFAPSPTPMSVPSASACQERCQCSMKQVVEFAVKASQALNLKVSETSSLPVRTTSILTFQGYQISQFDKPLSEHGFIEVTTAEGKKKRIGITRLHLEEDAGKSMHDGFADSDSKTYVDLNRTGTPLAEIVSDPKSALPKRLTNTSPGLKEIILYTGVSDCNMEEGSLRCDANISILPRGQRELGTKVEVKT